MNQNIKELCLTSQSTLRDVMSLIDRERLGIALIVDECGVLERTLTDGDVRRAILNGKGLNTPVSDLAQPATGPVTADPQTPVARQRELMREQDVRHLPLLKPDGTIDSLTVSDELDDQPMPLQAVIMAGGFGTRLRPLTDNTPKPMLQVGGKPLIERTVENLERAGVRRINITTHYLPEKITGHFGNGDRFGVDISYVSEDEPLGTAGALRLMEEVEEPLLVINGDILTEIDYRSLTRFHRKHNAALSVAVRQYDVEVPYGVVEAEAGIVQRLQEKPRFDFLINAGIYLLEPFVRRYVPTDGRYDMTDLIEALLDDGKTVVGFPITEYWLDIGQHDDFVRAQNHAADHRRSA